MSNILKKIQKFIFSKRNIVSASYLEADDLFVPKKFLATNVRAAKNTTKIIILQIVLYTIISILLIRVVFLNTIYKDRYIALAEENRTKVKIISAPRGIIYDKNNIILAENTPRMTLYIDPVALPKDKIHKTKVLLAAKKLVEIDKTTETAIDKLLNHKIVNEPIVLANSLGHEAALNLYIKIADLPGVAMETILQRNYLTVSKQNNLSLSHILGYTNKISNADFKTKQYPNKWWLDIAGVVGIESQYNNYLRGTNGVQKMEVNATGIVERIYQEKPPTPGKNIWLSIDSELQNKAESILANHTKYSGRGIIVLQSAQNGEILSLVSLPGFNNNDFITGFSKNDYQALITNKYQPLFNRAISGEYQPGSVVKPIISLAALEKNVINQDTTINSTGGIMSGGFFFPDWKKGGHGFVTVDRALAESVNSFYYVISGGHANYTKIKPLGVEALLQYYKLFGIGNKSYIDLPNEKIGFLPSGPSKSKPNNKWYIGDTYNLSIGHGYMLVTPLQVNIFTGIIANNGILHQPHLLVKYGETANINNTTYGDTIISISQKNLDIVKLGMRNAVLSGTAIKLKDLPFSVAGKTGTAQTSINKPPHSWFTGFAPYEKPEVIITVLAEEAGEGSAVAVPIAKEVLLEWYKRKSIVHALTKD